MSICHRDVEYWRVLGGCLCIMGMAMAMAMAMATAKAVAMAMLPMVLKWQRKDEAAGMRVRSEGGTAAVASCAGSNFKQASAGQDDARWIRTGEREVGLAENGKAANGGRRAAGGGRARMKRWPQLPALALLPDARDPFRTHTPWWTVMAVAMEAVSMDSSMDVVALISLTLFGNIPVCVYKLQAVCICTLVTGAIARGLSVAMYYSNTLALPLTGRAPAKPLESVIHDHIHTYMKKSRRCVTSRLPAPFPPFRCDAIVQVLANARTIIPTSSPVKTRRHPAFLAYGSRSVGALNPFDSNAYKFVGLGGNTETEVPVYRYLKQGVLRRQVPTRNSAHGESPAPCEDASCIVHCKNSRQNGRPEALQYAIWNDYPAEVRVNDTVDYSCLCFRYSGSSSSASEL
ncbi:uncharacterized protein MYCFIDRAFT_205926 [Pseudocercospora fijiensis CIRAD86]|uniref:Uncharacterized protein n=1 Tax=Pseudocercospora fijiensis (strain CIRAD86) TaxID=383855 RepID=N1Q8S8_PSEFD|nr:uncharacterized protein MYCFIDRAFT_205926 [Pseudocercospora fijiensis CIRAD86]EME88176.1 hypothetical protein MYCFIDRAFT_205926 [Pseudocercospora fijiensis CIRAD86]